MDKTSLGDRMKGYERTSSSTLLRRTPVIVRVDGKAFHTYTKKFNAETDPSMKADPFSDIMHQVMAHTAMALTWQTQNAVLGYTQSDEISILLRDWDTLTTDQWFGGSVQKIVSTTAAMAASYFNYFMRGYEETVPDLKPNGIQSIPLFDSRVFNIPKEEVTNYFVWRQKDATRNSINMLARHYFSHKQLHGKNTSEVQDMLMLEHGVNWNNIDTWKKRGTCTYRNPISWSSSQPVVIDEEIPIFTQDREYIEKHLDVAE